MTHLSVNQGDAKVRARVRFSMYEHVFSLEDNLVCASIGV